MKKLFSVVMVLAMIFTLSGCTTYNNFYNAFFGSDTSEKVTTIKINVYEPLSGKYKDAAADEIKGIELAHEMRPSVLGYDVELIYADNKSSVFEAETVLDELFKYHSNFLLGSYGETLSLAASDYLKETDTPGITISATNPLITTNNSYYFTATYAESRQGYALANFAYNDQGRATASAVRKDGDDVTAAMVKRFNARIRKLANDDNGIIGNFILPADTTDYSQVIENLRNSGTEAVFVALNADDSMRFIQQCIDANYTNVLFLGSNVWNNEKVLKLINEKGLDVGYAADVAYASEPEVYNEFLQAYKSKYGENEVPSLACATAYDSYMLAIKAMEDAYNNVKTADIDEVVKDMTEAKAQATRENYSAVLESGIPSGDLIRDALLDIQNYEGASGRINYHGSNEAKKTVTVQHLKAGVELSAFVL